MSDEKENEEIIQIQSYGVKKQSMPPQTATCIFSIEDADFVEWCPRNNPFAITIVEVDEPSLSMKRNTRDEWTLAQWQQSGARPKQFKQRRLQRLPPPSLKCNTIRPHLLRIPRLPYLTVPFHYDLVEDSYLTPIIPVADQCFPEVTVYRHHLRQFKLLPKIPELQEPPPSF